MMARFEGCGDKSFWLLFPRLLSTFFSPLLEYLYLPVYLSQAGWMQSGCYQLDIYLDPFAARLCLSDKP